MGSATGHDSRRGPDYRHSRLPERVTWNLIGLGLPVVVALVTVPRLLAAMGTERFGVLTLAWVLIGYFSVFDLGLGRALTRSIASQLALGRETSLSSLVTTATTLVMALGVVVGTILALVGPILMTKWVRVPPELGTEVTRSILILAATVPCVLLSTAHRGVLEAFGRFDWSNQIRLPVGILNFLAPLAVVEYSPNLSGIVGSLAATRLACWYAYRFASRRLIASPPFSLRLDRSWLRPLAAFGGWVTVSTLIGPLMIYLDRFLVGVFVSLSAVAYYATPYDILNRLGLIPSAVIDAIFPLMSSALVSDRRSAATLHYHGMLAILFFMTPPIAVAAFYGREGLSLWLGSSFAEHAAPVVRWIAFGVLFNAIARVALNTLYADGRASVVAKLHLIELFPYLALLSVLGLRFGIQGVAAAWTARVLADMCALQLLSYRLLHRRAALVGHWGLLSSVTMLIVIGTLIPNQIAKAALLVFLFVAATAGLLWLYRRGYSRVFSLALRVETQNRS